VGRRVTVTVSVDKIEGLNGREYEAQGALVRTLISPAFAAKGSDSIERIDSTRTWRLTCGTTTLIPKVERPGHT